MNTHLHIGITALTPGWRILLEQTGVDWSVCTPTELSPEQYSAVIVSSRLSSANRAAVLDYTRRGGAIIDCANVLSHPVHRSLCRTLFPEPADSLFGDIPLVDIYGIISSNRRSPFLQGLVSIEELGSGIASRLGLNVDRLLTDTRSRRKQFYSPSGLFPNETVALVSKGSVRIVVTRLLKELHFRRGLPFVHRRFFPEGMPNIFCFRIDSDGASRDQVQQWCSIAHRRDVPMTWFLHMHDYRNWLDVFRDFPEQETGIHAFEHKTFSSYEANWWNIQKVRDILDDEGFSYEGYAAPYGTWNKAVALTQEHHRFRYASEFSLSYDDVPFLPWVGDHVSPVLQIPIHPICIGSLQRTGMTEEQMDDYNRFVIDSKLYDGEPVIMYDHPLHPYASVLDAMFAFVQQRGIQALSFARYAQWWKRRADTPFSARWNEGNLSATVGQGDVWLDVWTSHTENRLLRPDADGTEPANRLSVSPVRVENIRSVRSFSKIVLRQSLRDMYNKWRR
jgi:hypothetical protein